MKFILFSIISVVSLFGTVAAPVQAIHQVNNKPKLCFQTTKTKIFVPYNLTKAQKKTLSMMKANSNVIDQLKLVFSLENNIIYCIKNGKAVNGFSQIALPTLVDYPSITKYTSLVPNLYLLNGPQSKNFKVKAVVSVTYSPKTGYFASTEILPIN